MDHGDPPEEFTDIIARVEKVEARIAELEDANAALRDGNQKREQAIRTLREALDNVICTDNICSGCQTGSRALEATKEYK